MSEQEAKGWIEEGQCKDGWRDELLKLYDLFQTRQLADLDMLHRYANYYVAALLAMIAALVIGLARGYDTPLAGLLVVLPTGSFMLSQQGKLMAFRFYRRYAECRARLTKIEYLLGLHGRVKWATELRPSNMLWPGDTAFVQDRYLAETHEEQYSSEFVQRRSRIPRCWELPGANRGEVFTITGFFRGVWARGRTLCDRRWATKVLNSQGIDSRRQQSNDYGVGYLIHITFTLFSALFVVAIFGLPCCLQPIEAPEGSPDLAKWPNYVYTGISLIVIHIYMRWYSMTLVRMEKEAPHTELPVGEHDATNEAQNHEGLSSSSHPS